MMESFVPHAKHAIPQQGPVWFSALPAHAKRVIPQQRVVKNYAISTLNFVMPPVTVRITVQRLIVAHAKRVIPQPESVNNPTYPLFPDPLINQSYNESDLTIGTLSIWRGGYVTLSKSEIQAIEWD